MKVFSGSACRKKHPPSRTHRALSIVTALCLSLVLAACSGSGQQTEQPPWELSTEKGTRDNTPVCLVPEEGKTQVFENDLARIDASHASEGYIYARYTGPATKCKLQITGADEVVYTYNLDANGQAEVFPLSAGDGGYLVGIYENVQRNEYAQAITAEFDVKLRNEFLPFLYPNQYVDFTAGDEAVEMGTVLAAPANEDLDVVSNVYNYIIRNVSYDLEKAEALPYDYLPDPDETLETGLGICMDFAALMTTMLRSQRIPARMEVGFAGTAYHAWISAHIENVGWVNGIIEFDGAEWSMMDPTFAASNSADYLESFIGDGSNYLLKYVY